MARTYIAVFFVTLTTLMLQLLLTRVFDVILDQNLAYMIITCALFAFGLAGVNGTLRPALDGPRLARYLSNVTLLLAVSSFAILPVMNILPFDMGESGRSPIMVLLAFLAMYLALLVPFFLAGSFLITVFSVHSARIRTLYCWDLTGAAVGCLAIIPFLPAIGPGGLLCLIVALALFASALIAASRARRWVTALVGLALIVVPFVSPTHQLEFREHAAKRRVLQARQAGKIEFSRWDPVSKIDVIDMTRTDPATGDTLRHTLYKHIAYDGGTQSSHIFSFDGDFAGLRANLADRLSLHFWQRGVLASHFLKADTGAHVLVIGCAGGQEVKAALLYGAARVEGVELVGTVVELGRDLYADYNGGLLVDPRVHLHVGEGRSYLRAQSTRYDIIQIFSNHNSSSIASGNGALDATYLQTAEAYEEYFEHLADDGILHINHHVYPRMVTSAAEAWRRMGRAHFRRHVVIFEHGGQDNLPTMLINMRPWTAMEIGKLEEFFGMQIARRDWQFTLAENPLDAAASFLPAAFYDGDFPPALAEQAAYHVTPTTDDRPFFNFLRKSLDRLEPDRDRLLNTSTALLLNSQLRGKIRIPMDVIHLFVTALASLFYAALFILLPLRFSEVGRDGWPARAASLAYFSCLGMGFILFELVFIQIFRKLIGSPLYTYSLVIFALLLGAGLGSLCSERLGVAPERRRWLPFAGIVLFGLLAWATYVDVFGFFLAQPLTARCALAIILVLPVGFFLGMPFPLGILALRGYPRGAIAWAWGMNGLFTVVGGLLSVVLALFLGFHLTLLCALAIYGAAFLLLEGMRRAAAGAGGAPGHGSDL